MQQTSAKQPSDSVTRTCPKGWAIVVLIPLSLRNCPSHLPFDDNMIRKRALRLCPSVALLCFVCGRLTSATLHSQSLVSDRFDGFVSFGSPRGRHAQIHLVGDQLDTLERQSPDGFPKAAKPLLTERSLSLCARTKTRLGKSAVAPSPPSALGEAGRTWSIGSGVLALPLASTFVLCLLSRKGRKVSSLVSSRKHAIPTCLQ